MKGGFEGSLFGAAVWVLASTENYFCYIWEVGYECEPGAGKPAYAKIAAAVVLSFSETRTQHFVVAWESFRSPAPTPLRAFTANRTR
jgi:hypothetical protein